MWKCQRHTNIVSFFVFPLHANVWCVSGGGGFCWGSHVFFVVRPSPNLAPFLLASVSPLWANCCILLVLLGSRCCWCLCRHWVHHFVGRWGNHWVGCWVVVVFGEGHLVLACPRWLLFTVVIFLFVCVWVIVMSCLCVQLHCGLSCVGFVFALGKNFRDQKFGGKIKFLALELAKY